MFHRLRSIVSALMRRKRFEETMADELRFHLDAFADDLIRSGVPPPEAQRRARLELGALETVREQCREARRLRLFDELRQDLRCTTRIMLVPPTRADLLRGQYGRYRANNDLQFYHLDIRVDPETKSVAGKNTIRFRMLSDDTRIQLELEPSLSVDRILFDGAPLKFERDLNTVYVDFPERLRSGRTYSIEFHYSGMPVEQGRFGGMAFRTDPAGRPSITTACEDEGAWWPNKDHGATR